MTRTDHVPEYQAEHDHDIDLPVRRGITPGRLPASAHLIPRTQIFLMPSTAAGAGDAPAAVDRAGATSGAALPDELRGRFERSLGADLSSVRLHTGGDSAVAARSLGARAYATGNDIHFGDGEYRPSDPFGVHLIAHEVAHTVQQAGRPAEPQTKLEVSSRGDACEVEADRAADAMIAGEPATISQSIATSGRFLREEIDPKYIQWAADDGEKRAAKDLGQSHATMGVVTATNIGDTSAAEAELGRIRGADDGFMKALSSTLIDPSVKTAYGDNQHAMSILSDYAAEAGVQSTSITNFKVQYERLMLDFERLSSMVAMSGVSGDQGGADVAGDLVKKVAPGAADAAAVHKDTDSPDAAGADVIAVKHAEVVKWKEEMTKASEELGPHERDITMAQNAYLAQCNAIASGLSPKSDPDAVTALNQLKANVEEIKGYAQIVAGFASKAVGGAVGAVVTDVVNFKNGDQNPDHDARGTTTPNGTGGVDIKFTNVPKTAGQTTGAAVGDSAGGKVPNIADFIVGLAFQAKLSVAQAKADAALEAQVAAQKKEQLALLTEKMLGMQKAGEQFIKVGTQLERAKNNYRRALMGYARAADRTGGRNGKKMQALASFLGEADAYLAQSKATMDVGKNEMQQADRTKDKRAKVTQGTGDDECRWWEVKEAKNVASDATHWQLDKHDVKLPVGAKGKSAQGEGDGDEGASAQIAKEMQRLQKNQDWIDKMRGPIAAQLNV